ncbi:MAG: M24 family metallopeptidase [Mycoplasmatales bacterium]
MQIINELNVDAFYITDNFNKRYITNFSGSTSHVVVFKDEKFLITDGRYQTQVKQELYPDINVIIKETTETYTDALYKLLDSKQVKKLAVEAEYLSYAEALSLSEKFELVATNGSFLNTRMVKNTDEIAKIKAAIKVTDETFIYIQSKLQEGITELEIKALLEAKQIELGASKASFDSIVAFGENSAKPHARPSKRKLVNGDIVTLDFGCYVDGYCSDMTRTFFVGTPRDEELVKIHQIVKTACELQSKAVKPGVRCDEIDKIGRDYITEHGYGELFMHGTGHGIGLDVHELPVVSQLSQTVLEPGMVLTIEPGIYKAGLGGCRIENDILVTEDGFEVLNESEIPLQIN